jgi:sirohydrochlorin ferrochelatase
MKALLIVAHGSRQKDANRSLETLSTELATDTGGKFALVQCAFLQFNGPFVDESVAELISKGARHIVIFPFFLLSGSHVKIDLPKLILEAKVLHPDVVFDTATFLGGIKGLKDLILDAV